MMELLGNGDFLLFPLEPLDVMVAVTVQHCENQHFNSTLSPFPVLGFFLKHPHARKVQQNSQRRNT